MIQGSVQACSESPAMGGPSLSPIRAAHIPGLLNLGRTYFRGRVLLKESGGCTPSRFG